MGKTIFNYIIHFEEIRDIDNMEGHEMSDEVKWKVGSRFLNNPTGEEFWLHMDDGNMGGGGDIDNHESKINDWGWAINKGYFDHQNQKFHYCLLAHYSVDQPDWYEFWEGDPLGVGESPGNMFCLFDENIDSSNYQAHVFMHELGHNLIGVYDPDGNYFGHNNEADHLIDTDSEDNLKEHCTDSNCALQTNLDPWENKPIDYCSDCWDALKMDWCF